MGFSETTIQRNRDAVPISRARSPDPSLLQSVVALLAKVAALVLAAVLLVTFIYGIFRYGEPGMVPAVKDGDLVLFYRYSKGAYAPQDAVVLEFEGQRQVRRVVATAGDAVDITEEGLLVNGALQQELEIYQPTRRYAEGVEFPLTVPEGHVFVLGDARVNATDSRVYGCVATGDTLGKVMTILRRRGI